MKKISWRDRLQYRFDNVMAKGTLPLIFMLLGITAAVVLLIGVLSWLLNRSVFGSLGNSLWQNLMHALDAGTLAGLSTESGPLFVALMTLTTVCGIFITSMLIGIINSGLSTKFENLRKGNSKVIESGHTVILGFDSRIYKTLAELVLANENRKKPCIVVLGELDKQMMDEAIRNYLPDLKNTTVICRSGSTSDAIALERCSLESCRSILVNEESDAKTICTILAVSNYLKAYPENQAHITAVVYEEANADVARLAGEGRAEILFFSDTMARIVAHTCRHPGLSCVYTELFSFDGNEIYIEALPGLAGLTFAETLTRVQHSCIIGIQRQGATYVNPAMDLVIDPEDLFLLVAEDDGLSVAGEDGFVNESLILPQMIVEDSPPESLLMLGGNGLLVGIVEELDRYVPNGSRVTIACDDETALAQAEQLKGMLQHMTLHTSLCNICDRAVLDAFVAEGYRNIVVLSNADSAPEIADATTLMALLYLRDISKKNHVEISITSEMQDVRNQELARVANVNDFVVSSNLTSLITAQISENRLLTGIFADLLDEEGSEIYLKPAKNYVVLGQPVDFFTVTRAAARRGEVFIGYKVIMRTAEGTQVRVVLNPDKSNTIIFDEEDRLVVIAEN